MDRKLLAAIVVCAGLAFWFWDSWAVYPLKLLVVMLHESGHALATWLAGGRVDSIEVNRLQGGLTLSRIPPGFLPQLLVSSGGYVGSTVFGAAILWLASRFRSGRPVLFGLAGFLAAALVLWVRDLFTAGFTVAMAALLAAGARFLPPAVSKGAAIFVGVFSGAYALWDIRDDLLTMRPLDRASDADMLAAATGVPALVWAIAWGVLSVGLLAVSVKLALRRGAAPKAGRAAAGA